MASRFKPRAKFERPFVTPEGIDLKLVIATGGQRSGAFMIDAVIMIVTLLLFSALVGALLAAFGFQKVEYAGIVWLLGFFLLRNGYFIAFELSERAATPGKRMTGIRVVARDGGRLTGDAVIARNLLREIEIFLPLSFLGYQAAEDNSSAAATLVGLGWALLFAFFPLFNRDRLRAGDMIAGTWVVEARRAKLGRNLVAEAERNQNRFDFTDEQLDAYGVFELQTLENVLRRNDPEAMATVAETIQHKIGWHGYAHDYDFLSAYYAALRGRLERNLLFGKRRADKYDS
ncbi:putative RDD family membrane protein YckC [Sphingomonas zeicaulis]|uniref:RDD family protein n=1 Tax=Sphingomonas zeicaulis TaxID=1632740 RepID=UPI003D220660